MVAMDTEHLKVIYNKTTQASLAEYVARCFEAAIRYHEEHFHYESKERITVILSDMGDAGNAAAGTNPRNAVMLTISPMLLAYETYPADDRVWTLANHELVHIVSLDQPEGSDNFFRTLFFGKVTEKSEHPLTIMFGYLTTPRNSSPRWYREGIAVFIETWMAGGYGRGQGPYDEMVFRSKVLDDSRIYDPLGLASEGMHVDFQIGVNAYLYGTRFITYLAYAYSPEKVMEWVSRREGSAKYYASQFKKVFGSSLDDVWAEWIGFEREFQADNIERIRTYPITSYRDISDKGLGSMSRGYYDPETREIYAAVNFPGEVGHIAAISVDTGSVRKIKDVKGPALFTVCSLAYDPTQNKLFYTTDNYDFRDLMMLDPQTGKTKRLFKDARIGDLAFCKADRSLYGIRHFNGRTTLVQIPYPYEAWTAVYSWPHEEVVYDLDVSPDGKLISTAMGEPGRQVLQVLSLEALRGGDKTPIAVMEDFGKRVPANFVFSGDGKYLYGSSYYTGASNIFRYEVATDSLAALTNAETGFFRPIPMDGDSLIVARYTGEGFVPAMIVEEQIYDVEPIAFLGNELAKTKPSIREWRNTLLSTVTIDSTTTSESHYSALANLKVESIYPVVEGYKDYPAYGLRFNVSDNVYIHQVGLTASYSPNTRVPDDERLHLSFDWKRYDWSLHFKHNDADFYDLVGPTKTSRKGSSLGIGYKRVLVNDSPRHMDLNFDVTGYTNLERLPDYQNVLVSDSFDQLLTGSATLSYGNTQLSLGAVDQEKGYKWVLNASSNYVNERAFPSTYGSLDFGFPLPVHHSSLWFRSSAGWGGRGRDREEPFANFFFGGFGNNYVDHGSAKRYREVYAFPGTELNEIGGTNFGRLQAELNLPPIRFRRFGFTYLYLTWIRTSVFGTGIVTNMESDTYRRRVGDLGSQVDFRLTLLNHLRITASVGYAAAFEKGRKATDELMFSVKIL